MTTLIVIGDILVCAFLVGLVAWLFVRKSDREIDKVARLPLLDDDK